VQFEISVEDPLRDDVRALIARHLDFAHEVTPRGHVHALSTDGLTDPSVTLFGARVRGEIVAIGALRELDRSHGELKSMHTAAEQRGQGLGSAMLDHLLAVARARGYGRVSLETGTLPSFDPARALYTTRGFVPCKPFGDYTVNEYSICMTLELDPQRT
jgi:putative acetyltransferase